MKKDFKTVDEYIATFSKAVQCKLKDIRKIILDNAPNAEEQISYGMPAYKTYKKPLVYFGGYEGHIGFYATPSGHTKFAARLKKFKQGKGSVQFPIDMNLPSDLITEIVKYRVLENEEKYRS